MFTTKIALLCQDNIPVLVDMSIVKQFVNIQKIISEGSSDKIRILEIEVKTLNNIIEYLKLLNVGNSDLLRNFIDKLEENMLYDIIIAAKILGIPQIILDYGNKIRELLV